MKDEVLKTRFLTLARENRPYADIATVLTSEGFVSKQGLPIDRKWVTTEVWRLRGEGIDLPSRTHRRGGGGKREAVSGIDFELVRSILRSSVSDSKKIGMLKAMFHAAAAELNQEKGEPK